VLETVDTGTKLYDSVTIPVTVKCFVHADDPKKGDPKDAEVMRKLVSSDVLRPFLQPLAVAAVHPLQRPPIDRDSIG
jgi:hypothetical protein